VQRRIDVCAQTSEQEGDVKRALTALKILVEGGADPRVTVSDGESEVPLWQLAERELGADHPITDYLKSESHR
jgi:hypothetical protein